MSSSTIMPDIAKPTEATFTDKAVSQLVTATLKQASVQSRMSGEHEFVPRPIISESLPPWLVGLVGQKFKPTPPPTLPSQLGPYDTGYISFDNGIPVGGNGSLTLYQDGTYSFTCHFHDSGAPSYDVDFVWVIASNSGMAFSFEAKGHVAGTFESGSRDWDFTQTGQNDQIKAAWSDLCAGYHYRWSAYVNWDASSALNDVIDALKATAAIVGAVVAIVAAF